MRNTEPPCPTANPARAAADPQSAENGKHRIVAVSRNAISFEARICHPGAGSRRYRVIPDSPSSPKRLCAQVESASIRISATGTSDSRGSRPLARAAKAGTAITIATQKSSVESNWRRSFRIRRPSGPGSRGTFFHITARAETHPGGATHRTIAGPAITNHRVSAIRFQNASATSSHVIGFSHGLAIRSIRSSRLSSGHDRSRVTGTVPSGSALMGNINTMPITAMKNAPAAGSPRNRKVNAAY